MLFNIMKFRPIPTAPRGGGHGRRRGGLMKAAAPRPRGAKAGLVGGLGITGGAVSKSTGGAVEKLRRAKPLTSG